MTELLDLFNKIVEYYGQWAALVIIIILIIGYSAYFLLKNYSTIIQRYLESRLQEKEKAHADAALHRKNVTPKVRTELLDLAVEVKADRVLVFEFSNGSSNLVGLPFLYMSATCEVITPGTTSIAAQYQRLNTAIVAEFLEKLEEKGYYYISNLEEIKNTFPVIYSLMSPNNVHSCLFYVIYGVNDTIGFVVATTIGSHSFTREDTLPKVAGAAQRISSLLNFDTLHEKL